jgi:hypothetical protein
MGELKKMCLALGSVYLLLGCAARVQETTQIQCTSRDGQILYAGPYIKENVSGYTIQLDDWTLAVYPKGACRKGEA